MKDVQVHDEFNEQDSRRPNTPPSMPAFSRSLPRAVLGLSTIAVVICLLVCWRTAREPHRKPLLTQEIALRMPAPRFQLYDQENRWTKFERYLGRTKIVLIFFPGTAVDAHPLLVDLFHRTLEVQDAGWQVVAISDAVPLAHRQAASRLNQKSTAASPADAAHCPFPVLSDIDPEHRVFQAWALVDPATGQLLPGIFLIDRRGLVEASPLGPVRVTEETARAAIFGTSTNR